MSEEVLYLMSIRPKYAYQIFTGRKKFELRRWIGIPVVEGAVIVVYVSGSVKALMGEFRAGRIITGTPQRVWNEIMKYESHGIERDAWPYIAGAKKAMAIEVLEPRLYQRPVKLDELRQIFPRFAPPLSFRVLHLEEPLYRFLVKPLREGRDRYTKIRNSVIVDA